MLVDTNTREEMMRTALAVPSVVNVDHEGDESPGVGNHRDARGGP